MEIKPYDLTDKIVSEGKEYTYYSLTKLESKGYSISNLPFSIRILLENVIRNYDGFAITKTNLDTLLNWGKEGFNKDIPFKPARVLMQDFTGVPAVVDIASLRAEMARQGKDPSKIRPMIPVDLVIDHSVQVDYFGTSDAYLKNRDLEYTRNKERYQFLKWAQKSLENFSVVPPGMGICHQVNLEYLASGVTVRNNEVFPDTLVGTDSHTPMVNGIGVLGWGVGGIEAEAAILGQPIYFLLPEVIGLRISGKLPAGTTATDLVLSITSLLRNYGVVGKFVEVFGPGLDHLSVPDRATISNMSPEFGCTVTYFPVDGRTVEYMQNTNRPPEQIKLLEDYCRTNLMWRENEELIEYSTVLELNMSEIRPTIAGPRRPQDKIFVTDLPKMFWKDLIETTGQKQLKSAKITDNSNSYELVDGSVVIAAITSCTNTSNPVVMAGAGLLARKARKLGLNSKPWVKTSLAPGSKVVTGYLRKSGLLDDLEALRFHIVGYGCTSCIGNSGPLPEIISDTINKNSLAVASVLSGNRNFEARVHPQVKLNYLMSPLLVVAYAIAGTVNIDILNEPLGLDSAGNNVFLRDIWPENSEIDSLLKSVLSASDFEINYSSIFDGDEIWKSMPVPEDEVYVWDDKSTYIKEAPFFKNLASLPPEPENIINARVLLMLGDSITTDHISPAGAFNTDTPAGKFLIEKGVERKDFNSYGSRRGNDEIMVRGTFANVRIKNKLAGREGGYTYSFSENRELTVFEASQKYREKNIPLLVLAGKDYGSGSSRDWAAKGTFMLGIKAVVAESYERIHRSNLIGMGVLPLQFKSNENALSLSLTGKEHFSITGIESICPNKELFVTAIGENGAITNFQVVARLDSNIEVEYYKHGGILNYVFRNL